MPDLLTLGFLVFLPAMVAMGLVGLLRLRPHEVAVWTVTLGAALALPLWYAFAPAVRPALQAYYAAMAGFDASARVAAVYRLAQFTVWWVAASVVAGGLVGALLGRTRPRWERWLRRLTHHEVVAAGVLERILGGRTDRMVHVLTVDDVTYTGFVEAVYYGQQLEGVAMRPAFVNGEGYGRAGVVYIPRERLAGVIVPEEAS